MPNISIEFRENYKVLKMGVSVSGLYSTQADNGSLIFSFLPVCLDTFLVRQSTDSEHSATFYLSLYHITFLFFCYQRDMPDYKSIPGNWHDRVKSLFYQKIVDFPV